MGLFIYTICKNEELIDFSNLGYSLS